MGTQLTTKMVIKVGDKVAIKSTKDWGRVIGIAPQRRVSWDRLLIQLMNRSGFKTVESFGVEEYVDLTQPINVGEIATVLRTASQDEERVLEEVDAYHAPTECADPAIGNIQKGLRQTLCDRWGITEREAHQLICTRISEKSAYQLGL